MKLEDITMIKKKISQVRRGTVMTKNPNLFRPSTNNALLQKFLKMQSNDNSRIKKKDLRRVSF